MALSDTVADLLTRVRNARAARHKYVDVMFSKFNESIIDVLKKRCFVVDYISDPSRFRTRILLRYNKKTGESAIRGIKRVSRPGCRRYVRYQEIPSVLSGLGVSIVSTSAGVMDGESAKKSKCGGELLCVVW